MVQSVELLLDAALDEAVRAEWTLLAEAGLPSQARHTGASNAPHVTVGVAAAVSPAAEVRLAAPHLGAGLPLRLGGLLVFQGRTAVLSRAVVPSAALIAVQAAVHGVLRTEPGVPDTMGPGRWTPHVTLARRLADDDLSAALAVLGDRPGELVGTVRTARRWDSDARRTWDVGV